MRFSLFGAKMFDADTGRVPHLFLSLRKPGLLFERMGIVAARTAYSGNIMLGLSIVFVNWTAAGVTQFIGPDFQAMGHRSAIIKDETLALPQTSVRWNRLEVFQNAALEMKHVVDSFRFEK